MEKDKAVQVTGHVPFEEAKLLKLNCDKALAYLNWHSVLSYEETVKMITDWYLGYYEGDSDLLILTQQQISEFEKEANLQKQPWAV